LLVLKKEGSNVSTERQVVQYNVKQPAVFLDDIATVHRGMVGGRTRAWWKPIYTVSKSKSSVIPSFAFPSLLCLVVSSSLHPVVNSGGDDTIVVL